MVVRALLVTAALLALAGCGGVDPLSGTVSCDFRAGSLNGPEPRCQEWQNSLVATTFESTCNIAKGKYAAGQCPRDGIVAGCQQKTDNADNSITIDWYYAPKTEANVQSECKSPNTFKAKP